MEPSSTQDSPGKTARDLELERYRRIQEDGKLLADAFRDLEARESQPHWPVCFRVAADLLERERAKPSRHEAIVANARAVRAICANPKKSDKVDARTLADLAYMKPESLHPIHHRGEEAQAHLAIARARQRLAEARTALINHVRGAVKAFGERLPSSSSSAFADNVAESIPEMLRPALTPVLRSISQLNEEVGGQTRLIEQLCEKKYPETERLTQVKGVGALTALCYILTLEDPERFSKSRKVGAFLGLTPRQKDSGDSKPQLGISECGDRGLRRLMVQCGHYILGPFGEASDLRRYGEAIAMRGGKNAKKRAAVAVARKLAVLLHRLWVSGAKYDPLKAQRGKKRRGKMAISSAA